MSLDAMPATRTLQYPITDAAELKAAFLEHRAYIDSCVSTYAAAGVTNAADYLERCCERHAARPALEHVRLPLPASADGSTPERSDPPPVLTYEQLNRMASRMACLWLARGFGTDTSAADTAGLAATAAASGTSVAAADASTSLHAQAGNAHDGVVGLLMENCPLYVAMWFGLAKLGRTVALLSTALKSPAQMKHSIDIARARVVVVSLAYKDIWQQTVQLYEAEGRRTPKVYWSEGAHASFEPMLRFDATFDAAAGTAASPSNNDVPSPDAFVESALVSIHCAREALRYDFRSLRSARRVGMESALFYIYTSGTTGASKAALFSHRRFLGAGVTWAWPMELGSEDRYLIVLPLFHGNGGVVALSACAHVGACALIRERFSVSSFWADVARHRATAMIYVGELWRYLHNASKKAEAKLQPGQSLPLVNTTLRVVAGNGLRADIWEDCCRRFARPPAATALVDSASSSSASSSAGTPRPLKVVEHYGMTEMPAGPYLNFYGRAGACGFIPPDVRAKQGADKLVEFDLEAGAVRRVLDEQAIALGLESAGGRCVEVSAPDQAGECLFLLAPGVGIAGASQADNPHTERGEVDRNDATALTDPLGNPLYMPYRNYTDSVACARRVYRNVFAPLDAWFATGDLLSLSPCGFFSFCDRCGDSYRWKGHNIVSNEVAEVLARFDPVRCVEANVYGVEWPTVGEGRTGMASVLWKEPQEENTQNGVPVDGTASAASAHPSSQPLPASFDPVALLSFLRSHLPAHAVPSFLRLRRQANSATSTFKFHKHLYGREGFDPAVAAKSGDIVLWWPGAAATTKDAQLSDRYELLTQEMFQRLSK